MKVKELYEKHYGDKKSLLKEEVIDLLKHFSLALEQERKDKIKFAKLHVEAALKAAAENAKWESKAYETRFGDNAYDKYDFTDTDYAGDPCKGYTVSVNKDSILRAYPDELIK